MIRGVTFGVEGTEQYQSHPGREREMGVIAQEVQAALSGKPSSRTTRDLLMVDYLGTGRRADRVGQGSWPSASRRSGPAPAIPERRYCSGWSALAALDLTLFPQMPMKSGHARAWEMAGGGPALLVAAVAAAVLTSRADDWQPWPLPSSSSRCPWLLDMFAIETKRIRISATHFARRGDGTSARRPQWPSAWLRFYRRPTLLTAAFALPQRPGHVLRLSPGRWPGDPRGAGRGEPRCSRPRLPAAGVRDLHGYEPAQLRPLRRHRIAARGRVPGRLLHHLRAADSGRALRRPARGGHHRCV